MEGEAETSVRGGLMANDVMADDTVIDAAGDGEQADTFWDAYWTLDDDWLPRLAGMTGAEAPGRG